MLRQKSGVIFGLLKLIIRQDWDEITHPGQSPLLREYNNPVLALLPLTRVLGLGFVATQSFMALAVVPCVYAKCVRRTGPEMREMLRQMDAVSGKIILVRI